MAPRRRRRVGAAARPLPLRPGDDGRAPRRGPGPRRVRGRRPRPRRSAARAARGRPGAASRRSRRMASRRSTWRRSSARPRSARHAARRRRRGRRRTRTTPSRTSRSTRPRRAATSRSAGVLLAAGADVNATQHGGYTPLHEAAQHGDVELVELFLSAGADPTHRGRGRRDAGRPRRGGRPCRPRAPPPRGGDRTVGGADRTFVRALAGAHGPSGWTGQGKGASAGGALGEQCLADAGERRFDRRDPCGQSGTPRPASASSARQRRRGPSPRRSRCST